MPLEMQQRNQPRVAEPAPPVGQRPQPRPQRRVLAAWRADYNAARPHTSVGGLTPIEYANRAR